MSEPKKAAGAARPEPREGARVMINIPLLEDQGSATKIDQTETVIINGVVTRIARGEPVAVRPEVLEVLRGKYPHI
jgi:hypothetical protein